MYQKDLECDRHHKKYQFQPELLLVWLKMFFLNEVISERRHQQDRDNWTHAVPPLSWVHSTASHCVWSRNDGPAHSASVTVTPASSASFSHRSRSSQKSGFLFKRSSRGSARLPLKHMSHGTVSAPISFNVIKSREVRPGNISCPMSPRDGFLFIMIRLTRCSTCSSGKKRSRFLDKFSSPMFLTASNCLLETAAILLFATFKVSKLPPSWSRRGTSVKLLASKLNGSRQMVHWRQERPPGDFLSSRDLWALWER